MWELENLTGLKLGIPVHVLENLTDQYDILIGCDVLNKVGFQIQGMRDSWEMTLGKNGR